MGICDSGGDGLFSLMKSLQLNTGQFIEYSGNDINVEPAWLQGWTGCNVTVAVVDDGMVNFLIVKSMHDCIVSCACRFGFHSSRLDEEFCK